MEEDRAANQRSAVSLSFTLALYISNGFGLRYVSRFLQFCHISDSGFVSIILFFSSTRTIPSFHRSCISHTNRTYINIITELWSGIHKLRLSLRRLYNQVWNGWSQTLFLKNPKSSNFGKILWPYFSVSKTDPKNEILTFFAYAIFEKVQNYIQNL